MPRALRWAIRSAFDQARPSESGDGPRPEQPITSNRSKAAVRIRTSGQRAGKPQAGMGRVRARQVASSSDGRDAGPAPLAGLLERAGEALTVRGRRVEGGP